MAKRLDIIGDTLDSGTINLSGLSNFNNTTTASSGAGALVINGGVYINKNLLVNESIDINNNIPSISITTGSLTIGGGVGISGSLYTNGRISVKTRTVTENTSLDDDYILNVNAGGGGLTITLPDLTNSTYDGVTYMIIKQSVNTVTINTATTPDKIIIDGIEENSINLDGETNERIILISNGVKWFTI
jgi:hypothetical protein